VVEAEVSLRGVAERMMMSLWGVGGLRRFRGRGK